MNAYTAALDALGWMEVTLWYRHTPGALDFNHLEDGHCPADRPTPRSPEQKRSWAGGRWSKLIWFAKRGLVPRVLPTTDSEVRS